MKNIILKLIILTFFLFLGVKTQAQSYFYVDIDAPAGGNGLTWATAYNNLQDGIDDAAAAFTSTGTGIVRVSDGAYFSPGNFIQKATSSSLTDGFQLKNGVQIFGGYNARNAPDWLINATRFFGGVVTIIDQGLYSTTAFEVHEDLGDQTVLNGLTIRGMKGIRIINPPVWYINHSFSPKIINCSFDILPDGIIGEGGISANGYLTSFAPTIVGCSFSSLISEQDAIQINAKSEGGIDVNISQTIFTNTSMSYNAVSSTNGTMNIIIDRCEFKGSQINCAPNELTIEVSNSVFSYADGLYLNYQFNLNSLATLKATNCTFSNSRMFNVTEKQTYLNCLFYDVDLPMNSTSYGGLYLFETCLFNNSYAIVPLTNNPQITVSNLNTTIASPLFMSATPNSADYLKLSRYSPARNAGDNAFIPANMTKDLGSYDRILENTVDIGAYEFCSSIGNCQSTISPSPRSARVENTDPNLKDLIVYPNPVKDVVKIKTTATITSMELLNLQGQEVKKWNAKSKLYVGDLPTGTYLLKVNTAEGTKNVRIVKE